MKQTLHSVLDDDWEIDIKKSFQEKSIKILKIIIHLQILENSNWFSRSQSHPILFMLNLHNPVSFQILLPYVSKNGKQKLKIKKILLHNLDTIG